MAVGLVVKGEGVITPHPSMLYNGVDADRGAVTTSETGFDAFFKQVEPRVRAALCAAFGVEVGAEAAAEAMAFGWESWERVSRMENSAGYLFKVGRDRARRIRSRQRRDLPLFHGVDPLPEDWFEPGLPGALETLSEKQRSAVILRHGYGWSLADVAQVLGVGIPTVQKHAERGLARLRRELGVER